MNIESVKPVFRRDGKTVGSYTAIVDGCLTGVPINTENRYYIAIQEWLAEGNSLEAGYTAD